MQEGSRKSSEESDRNVMREEQDVEESSQHSRRLSQQGSRRSSHEFQARPIRLAKRGESKPLEEKNDEKDESTDFQCRPIRLASKNRGSDGEEGLKSTTSSDVRSVLIRSLPVIEAGQDTTGGLHTDDMIFAVCLVDFHHVRGPEIQWWKSTYVPEYPSDGHLFRNLAFQALPDGSHLFEETFSNFNLVFDFTTGKSYDSGDDYDNFEGDPRNLKTLFGCSCIRQIKLSSLTEEERNRNKDFTRSIIQKAIIVISRSQPIFQIIKEKLSIITASYFLESNFSNTEILESLFDNLNSNFKLESNLTRSKTHYKVTSEFFQRQDEFFINLNLRETLLKFTSKILIIFKALILEKKILIYSNSNLEMLTQFQNNLISLIPNLVNNLDNSGCPLSDFLENNAPISKPTSLNTTSRQSMLRFFGLPLQLFNTKGSFWNPYLPLQQLNELNSTETKGYMVGCSNLLFVNQLQQLEVDILVNLDTAEISYPSGHSECYHLPSSDRKFINSIIQKIQESSGSQGAIYENDSYMGSDDYIRYMFEDYILSLLATTRYDQYVRRFQQPPPGFSNLSPSHFNDSTSRYSSENENIVEHFEEEVVVDDVENGKLALFNSKFVDEWFKSKNFQIWNAMADDFIFNFVSPKHIASKYKEGQLYKISSFFDSFKSRLNSAQNTPPPISTKSEAQKYIPVQHESRSSSDKNTSSSIAEKTNSSKEDLTAPEQNDLARKISSWTSGWGFKKK